MKRTEYYKVAEHVFSVSAEMFFENYEPFLTEKVDKPLFSLEVLNESFSGVFTHEISQEEEGQAIICGHTEEQKSVFEFWLDDKKAGVLITSSDYKNNALYVENGFEKFSVDNALMIIFALSTAMKSTLLFHSSVIIYQGKGYMFLGKSGTGKSTHSRLWLQNILGSRLLNDDNPVVRIFPEGIKVFGSPWSGKTECYKNEEVPLGAIVLLSQAKYNKISELKGVMAYVALVPSVSGKRWDKVLADNLHASETALIEKTKIWHLECLPDKDAAILCKNTISCN
ncbi:MAG: hypothetical protein K5685_09015 [Bacteroidales bacterium]|nr:hypothetical protein [Bacteroidales bacterium]